MFQMGWHWIFTRLIPYTYIVPQPNNCCTKERTQKWTAIERPSIGSTRLDVFSVKDNATKHIGKQNDDAVKKCAVSRLFKYFVSVMPSKAFNIWFIYSFYSVRVSIAFDVLFLQERKKIIIMKKNSINRMQMSTDVCVGSLNFAQFKKKTIKKYSRRKWVFFLFIIYVFVLLITVDFSFSMLKQQTRDDLKSFLILILSVWSLSEYIANTDGTMYDGIVTDVLFSLAWPRRGYGRLLNIFHLAFSSPGSKPNLIRRQFCSSVNIFMCVGIICIFPILLFNCDQFVFGLVLCFYSRPKLKMWAFKLRVSIERHEYNE